MALTYMRFKKKKFLPWLLEIVSEVFCETWCCSVSDTGQTIVWLRIQLVRVSWNLQSEFSIRCRSFAELGLNKKGYSGVSFLEANVCLYPNCHRDFHFTISIFYQLIFPSNGFFKYFRICSSQKLYFSKFLAAWNLVENEPIVSTKADSYQLCLTIKWTWLPNCPPASNPLSIPF